METLLKLLEENARYTNAELALMCGVSEAEVASDIKKLEQQYVIGGYKAVVDWDKIDDRHITALIELNVAPQLGAGFDKIAEKIMEYPEVESLYLMSGGFDLTVVVRGQTFQQVAMFVAKSLSTLEGVQSTATHFVLRRYKELGVDLWSKQIDDRGSLSL